MVVWTFLRRRRDRRPVPPWAGLVRTPPWPPRRPRRVLLLLPIVLTGCRTVGHGDEPPTPPAAMSGSGAAAGPAAAAAPGSGGPAQAMSGTRSGWRGRRSKGRRAGDPAPDGPDFSDKVTPEQKYNVHLELGRFQESQENFDLALEEYQKALEACEHHFGLRHGAQNAKKQAVAHRRMGNALDRLGRFDEAENAYRTALKLSPNDPKVWNDAGYSYYLQGRWADAERALKTAGALDPSNTRVRTNLGLTLAASGKVDAALASFIKAGGPAVGHANLAYILAAMGKTAEAQKHYKIALEYQPELGPARMALAALDAQIAQANQIAANHATSPNAPLLINQPGVLPANTTPVPPAVMTAQTPAVAAPAPTTPAPGPAPTPGPGLAARPAPSPPQLLPAAALTTAPAVDPAVGRTAAPAQTGPSLNAPWPSTMVPPPRPKPRAAATPVPTASH